VTIGPEPPAGVASLPTARFPDDELGVALPISAVAARTGLSQATLRMWQQRYGLAPTRITPGGHRRYSRDDIERLAAVQRLIAAGVSTGDAARAVLAAARHDIPLPADADPVAHRVCAAALDLDGPTVRWLLRDHLARTDAATTWEAVVRPVLGPVGDRWNGLPHGIAVEHLLSHVATTVLAESTPAAPPSFEPVPVLLASVPDDAHDLPLVALAAALGRVGVATSLLGASTPAATLAHAVRRRPPTVVVLYAHMAEHADTSVFGLLPASTAALAAGPGWDPARLATGIAYVNDLAAATAVVTARATHLSTGPDLPEADRIAGEGLKSLSGSPGRDDDQGPET
jgi:MerR family transcriptional regulator, light-induced transcriptional regulator